MTTQQFFTDPVAQQIWEQYFSRVARASRALGEERRRDLRLEIQDHLHESFSRQSGDSEAKRLIIAIDKIGEPVEFIRPLLSAHLLAEASRTRNPRTIITGLWYNTSRGLKAMWVTMLFFLGYGASLTFMLMAVGKPFFPDNIGLFRDGYDISLGIFDKMPAGTHEVLGWYMIPMALSLSIVLFLVLTRLLRRVHAGTTETRQE